MSENYALLRCFTRSSSFGWQVARFIAASRMLAHIFEEAKICAKLVARISEEIKIRAARLARIYEELKIRARYRTGRTQEAASLVLAFSCTQ